MPSLPSGRLGRAAVLLAVVLVLAVGGVAWRLRPQPPAWLTVVDPEPGLPPVLAKIEPGSQHGDAYTVTYDVRDLVNYLVRLPTAKHHTAKAGPMEIDQVATLIVENIRAGWGKTSILEEINGTHLVIHTRKPYHAEIGELLDALRRLGDVAILLQTHAYEVDRAVYEEQIEPKLTSEAAPQGQRYGAAVPASVVGQIIAAGARSKHETAFMVPNGETARLFSRRQAAASAADNPQFKPAAALVGVVVRATVNISMDRRFVLVHLDQETTEQSSSRTTALYNENDVIVTVTTPNLAKKTIKAPAVEVADGGALVLPLPTLAGKDGDRVTLLVIQPTIHIEAEEQAVREQKQPLKRSIEWLKRATLP